MNLNTYAARAALSVPNEEIQAVKADNTKIDECFCVFSFTTSCSKQHPSAPATRKAHGLFQRQVRSGSGKHRLTEVSVGTHGFKTSLKAFFLLIFFIQGDNKYFCSATTIRYLHENRHSIKRDGYNIYTATGSTQLYNLRKKLHYIRQFPSVLVNYLSLYFALRVDACSLVLQASVFSHPQLLPTGPHSQSHCLQALHCKHDPCCQTHSAP